MVLKSNSKVNQHGVNDFKPFKSMASSTDQY